MKKLKLLLNMHKEYGSNQINQNFHWVPVEAICFCTVSSGTKESSENLVNFLKHSLAPHALFRTAGGYTHASVWCCVCHGRVHVSAATRITSPAPTLLTIDISQRAQPFCCSDEMWISMKTRLKLLGPDIAVSRKKEISLRSIVALWFSRSILFLRIPKAQTLFHAV